MHETGTARPGNGARSRRWSLQRSTVTVAVVTLVLVAVAAGLLISTATSLGAAERHQNQVLDPAQDTVANLLSAYLDQETGLRGYVLAGDPAFLQPYQAAAQQIPALEDWSRTLLQHDPGTRALLDQMIGAYQHWSATFAQPQLQRVQSGDLAAAQHAEEGGGGKALFDAIRNWDDQLGARLLSEFQTNADRVSALQGRLEALLLVMLILIAAVIVLILLVTVRGLVRPLQGLARAAREVAGGRLHAEVPAAGPRDLQNLAADLTAMRYRLLEEITKARLAGEALQLDGPTVSALHDALTPRQDEHPELVVVGRLDPAEGVLAGDWYDLIRVGDALAVVVGDVSGHGPRSAVMALTLRSTIVAQLLSGGSPGDALQAAASAIASVAPEHFATVFVAVIEPAAGTLRYANGGHPSALLARGPEHSVELAPTGPFVSPIVATWSWSTRSEPFRTGDRLLVYTDGVTEGRNATKEEFGLERLKGDLATTGPGRAGDTVQVIAEHVDRFVGASQSDDRTLVYVLNAAHRPVS